MGLEVSIPFLHLTLRLQNLTRTIQMSPLHASEISYEVKYLYFIPLRFSVAEMTLSNGNNILLYQYFINTL